MSFDLRGKDDIIKKLSFMKKSGRTPHSVIFSGEESSGRKTVAKYFAALLICENPIEITESAAAAGGDAALGDSVTAETKATIVAPCGMCRHCRRILSNSHPDFITPERTGKMMIYTRDTMRQVVADTAIKPNDTDRKIYFFPEFDNTAIESQNILLKSIEEPPGGVQFIFTVTDPGVLLTTILSRSVVIDVRDITGEFTREANAPYFERAAKIAEALLRGDEYTFSVTLHESSDTVETRSSLKKTLQAFEKIIRDAVMLCETGSNPLPMSPCEEAKALARKFPLRRLVKYFDIVEEESKKLSYITNTPLTGASITAKIFSA
jgi:DNA polymerase-3 subunit delta'